MGAHKFQHDCNSKNEIFAAKKRTNVYYFFAAVTVFRRTLETRTSYLFLSRSKQLRQNACLAAAALAIPGSSAQYQHSWGR